MTPQNTPMQVFISYARKDEDCVIRLENDLQKLGIPIWRDRRIEIGQDWEVEIRKAIYASSSVIYLGTPAAFDSRIVRSELLIAQTYKKTIHPVFAKGHKWPAIAPMAGALTTSQYADIRGEKYPQGLQQLADLIIQQFQSGDGTTAEVPVMPQVNPGPTVSQVSANKEGPVMPQVSPDPAVPQANPDRNNPPPASLWKQIRQFVQNLRGKTPIVNPQLPSNPARPEDDSPPRNPYKGLSAFKIEDARDFFGRKEMVDWMLAHIKQILEIEKSEDGEQEPHFLTVIGPSGSGKSSVVMAGLLPRLQQSKDIPGSNHWICLPTVLPGKKPLEALAQALSQKLSDNVNHDKILAELQNKDSCALHSYAEQIALEPGDRVLLLIDQFEELFTETTDEEEREQFLHQLITAATRAENKVIVIVTLRADFSDHPMRYPHLHHVIEAHRIAIPPMTIDNLHAVIEEPARLAGLRFEENLVGDILFAIRGQEENLPLLQFTLTQLYERRRERSLTRQAYHAIGGVRGALKQHAEETYQSLLTNEHRQMAKVLFTQLINPGGLDQDATRRRVRASELTFADDAQSLLMEKTRQDFIAARLITANRNPAGHANAAVSTYEISHEALISAWTRLAEWIKTAREDILAKQTLNNDIERWERHNRTDEQLYTGGRLVDAQEWTKRTIPTAREQAFLQASDRYDQNQRNKRKWSMIARFALIVIIALGITGYIGNSLLQNYLSSLSKTVTTLQDSGQGSLRQVIHDAPPGSTITFAPLLSGRIVLSRGELNIERNLTLAGPDDGSIILTNNKGQSNAKIHVATGVTATFTNLSFQDSYVSTTATTALNNTSFIENEGNLTLNNCTIKDNASESNGGGIANWHGTLTLNNSTVVGNRAGQNGGGIYSWDGGALTLNASTVQNNTAVNDGGGIYELTGLLTLAISQVLNNRTTRSDSTSNGGGISVLDGGLDLEQSTISHNTTQGYGGGLTLLGSVGKISRSTISGNTAGSKGGGLAVEKNSESGFPGVTSITNMQMTNTPQSNNDYIGRNTAPHAQDSNILGKIQLQSDSTVTVFADTTELTGSPAPSNPPENSHQFLGSLNLDEYCHTQYPYALVSVKLSDAEHMECVLLVGTDVIQHMLLDPQRACQWQYHQPDVINRLADYYDPSSWQCYQHEKRLGPITADDLNAYCQHEHYIGVYPNGGTAYNWFCHDQNGQRINIAITDVCQWHYDNKQAFDRLTDFNKPDGWECWGPD